MTSNTTGDRIKPRRYSIDLAGHMACCEANYVRLCKLMPNLAKQDHWSYRCEATDQVPKTIDIRITERARYTTMLEVSQHDGLPRWSGDLMLRVRLYHDANMAEVTAWDNHDGLRARYEYPNKKMYQRDEKSQINTFLADWLSHSLSYGRSTEPVRF